MRPLQLRQLRNFWAPKKWMDGSQPWDGGDYSYFSGDWILSQKRTLKLTCLGGQWNFGSLHFLQKVPEDVRPKMTIDIPRWVLFFRVILERLDSVMEEGLMGETQA